MSKTYAQTGVDVEAAGKIKDGINSLIAKTKNKYTPRMLSAHYAGLFEVGGKKLAIHCDGVGSKILVAHEVGVHNTVGIDAVAMNVNDLVCVGSRPAVGVDYIAISRPDEKLVDEVMQGLVAGCKEAGIALVGGETAILPDMIKSDKKYSCADYDLALTVVGIMEREPITGERIQAGDVLVGLASTGLHSNGFTLARKILDVKKWGKKMLVPTKIYVAPVLEMIERCEVRGIAHITGGAFSKLERIGAPAGVGFLLDNMPEAKEIFAEIEKKVEDVRECYRTFNMGVGMVIVAPQKDAKKIIEISKKYKIDAQIIGKASGERGVWLQKNERKTALL
ncbi:phosphoribosylformylglycinamidine cyclo-ligase [Candidatus Micrarchaeota archaeon CG10_big_fil_rev_8_21_14_0_10_45_29]|nr:MAG: phosphoribosylformylglycinamidine cyclo-ligase [Candidatus Micrarchaeota archaeon CG10_big_fil_rev_8_21_14_0_10_45_29]